MKELIKQPDDSYGWVDEGVLITHPALASRGPISPELLGFELQQTGGGCTAWTQTFKLEDGRTVVMMVTQDHSAELDTTLPVEIGLYEDYLEDPEDPDNPECIAFWTIDDNYAVLVDKPYKIWDYPE